MKSHNRLPGVPVKVLLENSGKGMLRMLPHTFTIYQEKKMIKATAYPERSYRAFSHAVTAAILMVF